MFFFQLSRSLLRVRLRRFLLICLMFSVKINLLHLIKINNDSKHFNLNQYINRKFHNYLVNLIKIMLILMLDKKRKRI